MEAKKIYEILSGRFGSAIQQFQENTLPPSIVVGHQAIVEVCDFLKKAEELEFLSLICLSAVDMQEKGKMAVVYHLGSMRQRHTIVLKVELDRGSPHVRTVGTVWPVAAWYEREAYDLLGVVFDGHPDLRRILMPEDWEGYPLRKDYVYPKRYHTWDV